MIAPVLPGETLKNLLLQARAVTDPVKDKLGGWWNEYYFFYVKHTDLDIADSLRTMHVEGTQPAADTTGNTQTYHNGGSGIDYTFECLKKVVEWYFRDDGEAWNAAGSTVTLDGDTLPLAKASERLWWDSLKLAAEEPELDSRLPGQYDDLPPHMAAFQNAYDQWVWMRENTLTEASFEDYLKTHGVRAEKPEAETVRKPELIRYVRDWSLPSNTVLQADGSLNSAVTWSIAERADKDRFFREPGFLFAVSVTRPKLFWRNQQSSASHLLDTPFAWLPAIMRNDPYTSIAEESHDDGLISTVNSADKLWWDQRDLYLYGDQFINYDPVTHTEQDDANIISLPTSSGAGDLKFEYATAADADNLFGAYESGTNGLNRVRIDGAVSLNILSHQRDHT